MFTGQELAGILSQARELITDESRWCKSFSSVDKDNKYVFPNSPLANKWDILGALWNVTCDQELDLIPQTKIIWKFLDEKLIQFGFDPIVSKFNDSVSHEQVIEFLNSAIKDLETYGDSLVNI